jgi:hypothetical protein
MLCLKVLGKQLRWQLLQFLQLLYHHHHRRNLGQHLRLQEPHQLLLGLLVAPHLQHQ